MTRVVLCVRCVTPIQSAIWVVNIDSVLDQEAERVAGERITAIQAAEAEAKARLVTHISHEIRTPLMGANALR